MSVHIANGMFGAVIIDPPGLARVDREYVVVQSEYYLGPQGGEVDPLKVEAQTPDLVVFNGYANQYAARPLVARTGDTVRVWVLAAGPNLGSSFHAVGGQFHTVFKEGEYLLKNGGSTTSTLEDVSENPRKLQILQIDGPAIARAFDDLDAAVTYATFVKIAGLDVHKPIYREKDNSKYSFVWAAKPERANDPRIRKFIAIYQNSAEVKAAVRTAFDGLVEFPWETAQANAQKTALNATPAK